MTSPNDLKNAGLKATLPRLKIINLFETSTLRHMTAEDVYRQLLSEGLDIGLATIYRVLTQFEQAGLLVRHHFESGKAVFELERGPAPRPPRLPAVRTGRGVLRRGHREAAAADRPRPRLRDPRARALPLRRVRQAAVPAPQERQQLTGGASASRAQRAPWRGSPARRRSRRLKSRSRKPSSQSAAKYAAPPPAQISASRATRWPQRRGRASRPACRPLRPARRRATPSATTSRAHELQPARPRPVDAAPPQAPEAAGRR